MQEIQEKINWVRCPSCGHKLFKMLSDSPVVMISVPSRMEIEGVTDITDRNLIEIKCHSCKEIVRITSN